MKKLFFTAVALVAFSGASMASTIADEEIVKENAKEINEECKVILKRNDDCVEWAIEQVNKDEVEFGCMTASEYTQAINSYIAKCNNH